MDQATSKKTGKKFLSLAIEPKNGANQDRGSPITTSTMIFRFDKKLRGYEATEHAAVESVVRRLRH